MVAFSIILAVLLLLMAAYQAVYAVSGLFYKIPERVLGPRLNRILVLIPSYKEDDIIIEAAKAAALQYYPKAAYDIVIIASAYKPETLALLAKMPVRVKTVGFEQKNKVQSLRAALKAFSHEYNAVVVLDAESLMQPSFLERMNDRLNDGYLAIQGQRSYRDLEEPLKVLDGLSELINTQILCKGHNAVGLSAHLSGTGMAFDYTLFREMIDLVDDQNDFGKELEMRLTERGIHIAYDQEAIIYDEKITESIKTQTFHLASLTLYCSKIFLKSAWYSLYKTKNLDFFDKHLQAFLPPNFLLPFVTLLGCLFAPAAKFVWILAFCLHLISFSVSIPRVFWKNGRILKTILYLPQAFWRTAKSLVLLPKI